MIAVLRSQNIYYFVVGTLKRRCSSSTLFDGKVDRYGGITVDLQKSHLDSPETTFSDILKESLLSWRKEGRKAVWLNIPVMKAALIPIAVKQGFCLHHSRGDCITMCQWMDDGSPSRLPLYATHQVGVAGFVLNEETGQVLMVQDKIRVSLWKFPGGLSNPGEDIADTAIREVYEETGVKTEFKSVISFRQQHNHPNAFGNSDIYVVCRLQPLTSAITVCQDELLDAKWMKIHDVAHDVNIPTLTTRICRLGICGMVEGFDKVDIQMEKLESIYRGAFYKIYHRPLSDKYNYM
ncbi:nucleoside diphosphate-linked moiety X motif 6-like [Saccoglossus kowalevskii]|uniref:Nucleoside diphosphate-linked moiety X motif 6-like n=1 Tax=Saccoglossus kowalevskii TaxID=10224 RepID=A0ABM0GXX5_SACKO|nr:PREDICTED: nucleoside diphosphate-linked moiety X motif 6-like [Saccoglossus kowalevskii]